MAYVPARRVRVLAALALPVLVAFASIAADATTRRADDARPARLQLVRALGLHDQVQVDVLQEHYRVGDVFAANAPVRLRRIGVATMALALLRLTVN